MIVRPIKCNPSPNHHFRMMFESGKLPPSYDYFRCVVNIPEDVQRVGDPSESGEQLSVMAGPLARSYGAATMAGKDERNGRINPALESDDDLPVAEARRINQETAQAQVKKMLDNATGVKPSGGGGGHLQSQSGMAMPTTEQDNTAF